MLERTISKEEFKHIAKLNNPKYRENRDDFDILIEGERLIKQVLDDQIPLKKIFLCDGILQNSSFFQKVQTEKLLLTKKQAQQLTKTENGQGVFAQLAFNPCQICDYRRLIYLNGISDPGNLGTIIRTAAAFKIDGLVLDEGCCDISNPKVVRASLGAVFSVPLLRVSQDWLKSRKEKIIITDPEKGIPLGTYQFPESPFILVIGSEAHGVTEDIKCLGQDQVYIPTSGKMQSLNAAVAAGIFLQQIYAQFCV